MATLKDAIYGVAIGDALGLPVQFRARDTYHIDGMIGHGCFDKEAGTWSDDTSMTLALCDSIRVRGKIDTADIRKKFEDWLDCGKYTPDGEAFDVGNTCYTAIKTGHGRNNDNSNGNGSLMRIIPLAFIDGMTDDEIAAVSAITHAHAISIEGCQIYVHIAQDLLAGISITEAIVKNTPQGKSKYSRLAILNKLEQSDIRSSGYVVDTLEAALWCLLKTNNYRDALLLAVNLGDDTDTVGAVAGGLASIMYGMRSIPNEWLDALRRKNIIDGCLF